MRILLFRPQKDVQNSTIFRNVPAMKSSQIRGANRRAAAWIAAAIAGVMHAWAVLALYFSFDGKGLPGWLIALGYLLVIGVVVGLARKGGNSGLWSSLIPLLAVAVWWVRRAPHPDRDYVVDLEQTASLIPEGSELRTSGLRDFRYSSEGKREARWSGRTYDLNELQSVDLIFWDPQSWDSESRIFTSFVFAGSPPLTVRAEPGVEKDESAFWLRKWFNQYEVVYLWGEERDLVGGAAAQGGELRLYRTRLTSTESRQLLLDMVEESKSLTDAPEFYHPLRDGAGSVKRHAAGVTGSALPWWQNPASATSLLKSGLAEGWLLSTGEGDAGKAAASIRARATKAFPTAGEFSQAIRTHLPTRESVSPDWKFEGPR